MHGGGSTPLVAIGLGRHARPNLTSKMKNTPSGTADLENPASSPKLEDGQVFSLSAIPNGGEGRGEEGFVSPGRAVLRTAHCSLAPPIPPGNAPTPVGPVPHRALRARPREQASTVSSSISTQRGPRFLLSPFSISGF
jgi:hypothetical protein